MIAADVVDRIKNNLGVPWREATYRDTYKLGGPDTAVAGIVSRDPLYASKVDLLRKHDIVVFRIHDHMHSAASGLHLCRFGA